MSTPPLLPEAAVLRAGETLAGRFQVVRPFSARSRSGCRFVTFDLDDGTRALRAYAWESDCQGFQVPRHRDRVYAAGRIRWRNAGVWPEGSRALRHLLTWEARSDDPIPGLAAMELVRTADRISAHHTPSDPILVFQRSEA